MTVPAVVSNQVLVFLGDVLCQFREKVERVEYLEVSTWPTSQIATGGSGETVALFFLRAINNRTILGEPNNSCQAERAAEDVLRQTFQAECVAR